MHQSPGEAVARPSPVRAEPPLTVCPLQYLRSTFFARRLHTPHVFHAMADITTRCDGLLLCWTAPLASSCARLGMEVAGAPAAPQSPQPRLLYGSRQPQAQSGTAGAPGADKEITMRVLAGSTPVPGPDQQSFLWVCYGEMKWMVLGEPQNRRAAGVYIWHLPGGPASQKLL